MKLFKKTEEPQPPDPVIEELKKKIDGAIMPDYSEEVALKELEMLGRINPSTSEYTIGLSYIQYLVSLPWNVKTEDNLDIKRAERILDEDHYGLHPIKERILEHLAVKTLRMNRRPQLLVVDDEEVARRNLEHILSKENYTVDTAANGVEALARLRESVYDVILTDFKMEKIDGMEVLEKTKAIAPHTQVIMITGYATIDTAVEAMKKGAFHYLAKPFKLDDVRETVRQALDSTSLKKEMKGSVLCFAGPPGTGKTSLGRSIARALGRKFGRISLGGIKDEAEIRGHRRTYAGAMAGRIVEEIRRSGSCNPVLILDELDKIGYDLKGDPGSALLEALDPGQNSQFMDHYLDMPFDLSRVMFIITANLADNIMGPLRDRMEVIQFSGYTEEEKVKIASEFLVPRQIRETGISVYPPEFADEALLMIIQQYTHEAGIRDLERHIAAVCRKIAREFVQHGVGAQCITVDGDLVEKFLGPRKYYFETAEEHDRIGVTTGLVWTEVGGDIIFVEALKMKGKQELILTGSLGGVMKESAQAALSYVRSNAGRFGIDEDFFEDHDVHIHVPAGAIPKDGPSAGVTIALALISLLTARAAKKSAAITGELTLSGRILPVGGIKEKILAARRARLKTVVLPSKNKVEIDNLPPEVKGQLEILFAETVEEVVEWVLAT
ncbi:MAG TPA: endopeptidase La [Candidatus Sulfobium mesophilum]|nr:endopeptidase La [Candidatus Sulfobium mesophilum]